MNQIQQFTYPVVSHNVCYTTNEEFSSQTKNFRSAPFGRSAPVSTVPSVVSFKNSTILPSDEGVGGGNRAFAQNPIDFHLC